MNPMLFELFVQGVVGKPAIRCMDQFLRWALRQVWEKSRAR